MLKVGLAVGLVIAWGSVLLPPVLRLFGGVGRASDSIGGFRDKMSLLGGSALPARRGADGPVIDLTARAAVPTGAASLGARRPRQAAKKRRRDILVGLLAGAGATLLLALVVGGLAWGLFGVTFVLLGAYVALLWQMQQMAVERRHKVAYLPHGEVAPAEVPSLRRVGSARG
jgi:hypothetical protein